MAHSASQSYDQVPTNFTGIRERDLHRSRKQQAAGEIEIVGSEDESPERATLQTGIRISPTRPGPLHLSRIQDTTQMPFQQTSFSQTPTSNASIVPNQGDEISSGGCWRRPLSEGEAVTSDMRQINIHDPHSPSSPVTASSPLGWLPPKKRPSNNTLPEAEARAAKQLHGHARSGPDSPFSRNVSQPTLYTTSHDPNRNATSHRGPVRPLTPRLNTRSPLGQRHQISPTYPPQPQSGHAMERAHSTAASTIDMSTNEPSSQSHEPTLEMLRQVTTRPITQDQLINEVKGIYSGLVMVEKKCVEVDQQQVASTKKLGNEQYQALIALHRTLLHEHHDFFLASQHPSAGLALNKLATKYAMPARMWRHGIHSFLELLRHRLPESLEHMLAFVYLAYSMMALLMESVPSFEETWIECLGDLARYRMAIEESDLRDRETWSGVARMWYNRAADKSPGVGRIQHHLAVLARPNIVQQLFYYSKALVSVTPFQNARESVMLLFNQFLEPNEVASQRYPKVESFFVKANGILFTRGSVLEFDHLTKSFVDSLDNHIGRTTAKYREQGPEMASAMCAALFDFGHGEAYLTQLFLHHKGKQPAHSTQDDRAAGAVDFSEDTAQRLVRMRAYWSQGERRYSNHPGADPLSVPGTPVEGTMFANSDEVVAHALRMFRKSMDIVFSRIGDKNVLSFAHVVLAFLWSLAFIPGALEYVQGHVPWGKLGVFLNTLARHGAMRVDSLATPQPGAVRQLPEDFVMRGLIWSEYYYPTKFFSDAIAGEDERSLELPSHTVYRAERCLWLGEQLSSLGHWLSYDKESKQFSVTAFAQSLLPSNSDDSDDRSSTEPSEPALSTAS